MKYFKLNKKTINKQYTFIRRNNMASFNDYLKEVDYFKQQLKADRDTLAIRREQLSFFKGFYGDKYENMLDTFDIAFNELGNVIDMMEGWIPVIEKDIPEDEKFLSETELKAKAFDKFLEALLCPEDDFIDKMDKIKTETIYSADCEPDPELDQEPEDLPECEDDLKVEPETINQEVRQSVIEKFEGTHLDDNKNGVAKFKAFYELLHKGK